MFERKFSFLPDQCQGLPLQVCFRIVEFHKMLANYFPVWLCHCGLPLAMPSETVSLSAKTWQLLVCLDCFFFFEDLWLEKKNQEEARSLVTPSHPYLCCCLSGGKECGLWLWRRPFLFSALFPLSHFGIWFLSSLPTSCSSTPLIKWASSSTFFFFY